MSRAQLFVGRLPLDTRERDLEQVFEKYGRLLRCDVKYGKFGTGMAYAFVDYDDRRDAENEETDRTDHAEPESLVQSDDRPLANEKPCHCLPF